VQHSRVVIALGGNALIRPGEAGTVSEQFARVREVAAALSGMPLDTELILTHGNGPQVGRVLLRSDLCADEVPEVPLDVAVASTQGSIGVMLQQALPPALGRPAVTVLTQTLVSRDDPDFRSPSKYVGRFYTEAEARRRALALGWLVKEDPGRGWRRVVPSPAPLGVVELPAIAALLAAGIVVVACGGGGVPVIDVGGALVGVEAVVDKDRASALLALKLGAGRFVVLTGVDEVMVDFGTPTQRPLLDVTAAEARAHLAAGQFPAGSMGPKVEAALSYLEGGGAEVLITSPERLPEALAGARGTRIRG
jgi:carbamate kinase